MRIVRFIVFFIVVFQGGSVFAATAKDGTGVSSQNLWRAPGPSNFVSLESSDVLDSMNVSFGALAGYYRNAIGLKVQDKEYWSVESVFGVDFSWAFGIMNIFQAGLVLPVIIHQTGEGAAPLFDDEKEADAHRLSGSAIGDLRVHLKLRMLGNYQKDPEHRGLGIALDVAMALPSGDENNFAGEKGVVFAPNLVFDFHHLPFSAGFNLGVRLRSGKKSAIADATVGNQLSSAAGVTVHLLKDKLLLSTEANLLSEMDDFRRMGIEFRGAVGTRPGDKSVTLWLSGGGGMSNRDEPLLSVPKMRFTLGITYAPGASGDGMDAFFN